MDKKKKVANGDPISNAVMNNLMSEFKPLPEHDSSSESYRSREGGVHVDGIHVDDKKKALLQTMSNILHKDVN